MKNYTDPRDAAALEAKRRDLARDLATMAHTRAAYHAGRASPAMMERAAERKHLLRVLEGPRPLYEGGAARLALLAVMLAAVLLAGCGFTLYSREWDTRERIACDALPELEARALEACRPYEYVESLEGGY